MIEKRHHMSGTRFGNIWILESGRNGSSQGCDVNHATFEQLAYAYIQHSKAKLSYRKLSNLEFSP